MGEYGNTCYCISVDHPREHRDYREVVDVFDMKVFSTFSGVEGFGMRFPEEWQFVGFSEIDKYASMVLKYHYPNVNNYGDISKIKWESVPDFDVLTGGSPCQDFSIAGKRRGLSGTRSSLAWEYIRCLRDKQPKYFIWENVTGALSSRGGWDFANLLCAFSESGYSLWWQILNAKDFGVPHNRERIFVVGTRADLGGSKEVFFVKEGDGKTIEQLNNPTHSNERVYADSGLAPALNTMQGGNRQPFVRITEDGFHLARNDTKKSSIQGTHVTYPTGKTHALGTKHVPMTFIANTKQGYVEGLEGDGINLSFPTSTTPRGRVIKGNSPTLQRNDAVGTIQNGKIRKLTPLECERVTGWHDDWTKYGINEKGETVEISDSQRYKMCGNGVVSWVSKAVAEAHIL